MDATAGNPPPAQEASVDGLVIGTADGPRLSGDVATPPDADAVAVLCHPHPNYGGDRFNVIIAALFDALPGAGVAALRFDFRRPVAGDGLGDAVLDVEAALDETRRRFADVPLVLAGYSFGAAAALATLPGRADVRAVVLIAPPLALIPAPVPPRVPTLVLVPAHDQFSPPDAVEPVVAGWPDTHLETIDMADHFLGGRTRWVADRVTAWLREVSR
jgi:alpha/beta superfamily hydrolase